MAKQLRNAVEEYFRSQYFWSGGPEDDALAHHLRGLCKKWGPITSMLTERFYIRSTDALSLGVDAKTGVLRYGNEAGGGVAPYIFIGTRLFYFVWRINMVCGTAWAESADQGQMVLKKGWPSSEHIEQVRLADDMYFQNDIALGTQGLAELNEEIFALRPMVQMISQGTVDCAELFILLHEIGHHMNQGELSETGLKVQWEPAKTLTITDRRREWWLAELARDANAMHWLLLSATAALRDAHDLSVSEARVEAASRVFAGVDAALDTLQRLEELRFGKVALDEAALSREFTRHPPSQFRKDQMSQISYSILTGNPIDELWSGNSNSEWQTVATNVSSQMRVRALLFEKVSD